MKILHTSDWHLGGRLHEQDRLEEHGKFLQWLCSLMRSERPDALLVCGDVFDTYTPSNAATRMYYSFLAETFRDKLCGTVIVIGGNHDSPSLLESPQSALFHLGTHVLGQARDSAADEIVVVPDADGSAGLVVAAVPFMRDSDLRNFSEIPLDDEGGASRMLSDGFRSHYAAAALAAREKAPRAPLVIMGHCTMGSARISDNKSERSRNIGGVSAFPVDLLPTSSYTALGHLHIPQAIGGAEHIRYSGSPLQMSFAESRDSKSVAIAEFRNRADAPATVHTIEVPQFQKLSQISGPIDTIIEQIIVEQPDSWACIDITAGEGDAVKLWADVDGLAARQRIKVLVKRDSRQRDIGSGITLENEQDLKELSPAEIARMRLDAENLSESDKAEFMAMLEPLIARINNEEGAVKA